MIKKEDFTKDEKEFLMYQFISRKDDFQREMKNGVKDITRLKEISFALDTLQKGIDFFMY